MPRKFRRVVLALLLLALGACGARTTASVDGSIDSTRSSDSSAADQSPRADGAPSADAAPIADGSPLPDAPPTTGLAQYLLWQSPGGFAGSGPALELLSNGTLRLWRQTPTLTPHKTSGWDYQTKLSAADTATIFGLLRSTNYNKLPHKTGMGLECYPRFVYDPCVGQPCALSPVDLSYDVPSDLSPELDAVYSWLNKSIGSKYPDVRLPDQYCLFFP